MKKYIWAFPGMGKSHIEGNGKIVDADCEQFKYIFPDGVPDNLHKTGEWQGIFRNPEYPENYFKYIDGLDADFVLMNCHISLLDRFEREQVLLVYPCEVLIPEYLERYKIRGDNQSFISYMAAEAGGMIRAINESDFKKYEVLSENTYLSNLFERNDFKVKVMTRKELIAQLQRAMDLKVIDTVYDENKSSLVCDLKFVKENPPERRIENAETWAAAVLDGKYDLDIDQLQKVCNRREYEIEEEKTFTERRGGLSREELQDKIMQGIVNGALGVYHGEIAPYSHGYKVTYSAEGDLGSTRNAIKSWHCYCGLFEVPVKIAEAIEKDTSSFDIHQMIQSIDEAEKFKLTSYIPEKDSGLKPRHGYDGHIASVMDVHYGKALDGIAKHHYHGTWSNYTTVLQNELVEALVFLKGFCLDCFYEENLRHPNGIRSDDCKGIVEYLKKHGTDITTQEKLNEWIKANPEKCGKEENRVLKQHFNTGHELYAQAYCDFVELKSIVDNFKGSFDELCEKLGGDRYDDNTFRLEYGVLATTIGRGNNELFLCESAIGIWDNAREEFMDDCISLKHLKETCKEIGYEIKALEAKALEKIKLSLDEQLKSAESRVSATGEKLSSPEIAR